MIKLLPWWACPVAVTALLGLSLYQRSNLTAERLEWASERLETAKQNLRSIEVAQAETIRMQGVKDEALKNAEKRAKINAAAAAGSRSELDGLRYELAVARVALSTSTREACIARADALTAVFDHCAKTVEGLAGKADGHAADALTLDEAWPTGQTTPP